MKLRFERETKTKAGTEIGDGDREGEGDGEQESCAAFARGRTHTPKKGRLFVEKSNSVRVCLLSSTISLLY